MLVLGIDTSCDDTSASLVSIENGRPSVITNIISSQSEIHTKYGGIVPELASRRHMEMITPVVTEALGETRVEDLSAVSVCFGPGLIGSLLVGVSFAKAFCWAEKIPLVAVNHLEGHALAPFLEAQPDFPYLCLVASGGHTSLYKINGFSDYEELGKTRDDAAGEAYDKVAKLLGLEYPGGPKIDRLAHEGDPKSVRFPRAYLPETFDFSFSGLKTAVVNYLATNPSFVIENVAASFQAAVTDVLVRKCEWAINKTGIRRLSIGGGVAANSGLKEKMSAMASKLEVELFVPSPAYCTDNAAMIAFAGAKRFEKGEAAGLDLNAQAWMPL